MGHVIHMLWALGVLGLAGYAAWTWSRSVMHALVLPTIGAYVQTEGLLLVIAGGLIFFPTISIGGMIGQALTKSLRDENTPVIAKVAPSLAFVFASWLVYDGWKSWRRLGARLTDTPELQPIIGSLIVFIGAFAFAYFVMSAVVNDSQGWSIGRWNRKVAGLFWRSLLFIPLLFLCAFGPAIIADYTHTTLEMIDAEDKPTPLMGLWLFSFAPAALILHRLIKEALGKATKPIRRLWRDRTLGLGHWATFAGLFEEWSEPLRPWLGSSKYRIFFGNSLYDSDWRVGIQDDRHVLTVAASGSGKGRTAIIPNLLTWRGNVVVIDPKGTNAAVTAARRGNGGGRVRKGFGQAVYCVNPYKVNEGLPGMPKTSRFNPLSAIDLNSQSAYQDINQIVDALVVPSTDTNSSFFDKSSERLLRVLIAHAIYKYGENATLMIVAEMIAQVQKDSYLVKDIMANMSCGGSVRKDIIDLVDTDEKTLSNIRITASQHMDWVADPAMQEALAASDFSIFDLKNKPTSLYIIIPVGYLATNSRFMRLFVNLTIKAASVDGRSKIPILMILDEFYSLGRMPSLLSGIVTLRSYNVKLWPIVHNLGQLVELYSESSETFLSSAGQVQAFGLNDPTTANYLAQKAGNRLNPFEIGLAVGRESQRQLIYREGNQHFVLNRLNYDKMFNVRMYNADPDHKGS